MFDRRAKPNRHSGRQPDPCLANSLYLLAPALMTAALTVGVSIPDARSEPTSPFEVAEVFFELNDTDKDLGIHAKIDGEPWANLSIEYDPTGTEILYVENSANLLLQGLTEFFFESAEPPFEELSPLDFFDRFPEGIYEVGGLSVTGGVLESKTRLTHVMPAPPDGIVVSGTPINPGEIDCDEGAIPAVFREADGTVAVSWNPVTMSHPDADGGGAAVQPPVAVKIVNYEVALEVTQKIKGKEFDSAFDVILPPSQTAMSVPSEFLDLGNEFKIEILAREESFNQTAIESCFELAE